MRSLTYLIYIVAYESLCLGGCSYLVFWRGANPWWFLLACHLSAGAYRPGHWAKLFPESKS